MLIKLPIFALGLMTSASAGAQTFELCFGGLTPERLPGTTETSDLFYWARALERDARFAYTRAAEQASTEAPACIEGPL
jgi:hypothetical protein